MKPALFASFFAFVSVSVPCLAPPSPVFLIDSEHHPHISVSWPQRGGGVATVEGDREYLAPNDKTPLGKNLSCYVALGGNRGDYGLGRPGAVDVRVGFYRTEKSRLFFDDLADGGAMTIIFSGVKFNHPARAIPETMVMHLKFEDPNNVLGCAGAPELLATWNTYSPDETMGGRLTHRNGRRGVLGPGNKAGASVVFEADEAGVLTMKAVIPYALLKHADDPWMRSNPGDFIEPVHFHLEFEAVARDAEGSAGTKKAE